MHPEEVFVANLSLLERVIARVCRKTRLFGPDAEDFASAAKLFIIEDDYAVLRAHDRSSSLEVYLAVVLHRFLINERSRAFGRWRASAEAKRMGIAGVLLEKLLRRDRRPIGEALPIVRAADATLTDERIATMAERLPEREVRPRPVALEEEMSEVLAARDDAEARVLESDRRRIAARAGAAIRESLEGMAADDRMHVKWRYGSSMQISDNARMLGVPQRPLYRRIEALLGQLRAALAAAGVDAAAATDLGDELDFGIADGKTGAERLSLPNEGDGG